MVSENKEIKHIIKLCKKDDPKAKKQLYEMFAGKMAAICYRYLDNKEDVEDALTDGFISVFENIGKYKEGNFKGWIYRIMVNSCLSLINKQKRFVMRENNTFFDKEENVEIDNPERFSSQDIMNALQVLTPREKVVFNMAVIDGFSHDEISQRLNLKKTSIKAMVYISKVKLRNYLINLEQERNSK